MDFVLVLLRRLLQQPDCVAEVWMKDCWPRYVDCQQCCDEAAPLLDIQPMNGASNVCNMRDGSLDAEELEQRSCRRGGWVVAQLSSSARMLFACARGLDT
jgi:hypothetical protein